MTLLEQLQAVDDRKAVLLAQVRAASDKYDWASLEPLRPLLDALDAERERLEIAHYGAKKARRLQWERKHSGQVELVASLRAAFQAAADEDNWDLVEKLVPIIKDARKRLSALSVPRDLRLVPRE